MYQPIQGKPLEACGIAPPPATMACWRSMPPITAPTTGAAMAALVVAVFGAPSSSRATMTASISTWPISSVATSMIRSLYLPGIRQFHPWNRYCIVTVISPYAPPMSSWSLCAKTGSGYSGLASNCRWSVCRNIGHSLESMALNGCSGRYSAPVSASSPSRRRSRTGPVARSPARPRSTPMTGCSGWWRVRDEWASKHALAPGRYCHANGYLPHSGQARSRRIPIPPTPEEAMAAVPQAEPVTAGYALCLLGGFELHHGGRGVAASPSAQRLLAYVATRRHAVNRVAAARALWPDYPDTRAAATLRSTLWRLRRGHGGGPVRAAGRGRGRRPGAGGGGRAGRAGAAARAAAAGRAGGRD